MMATENSLSLMMVDSALLPICTSYWCVDHKLYIFWTMTQVTFGLDASTILGEPKECWLAKKLCIQMKTWQVLSYCILSMSGQNKVDLITRTLGRFKQHFPKVVRPFYLFCWLQHTKGISYTSFLRFIWPFFLVRTPICWWSKSPSLNLSTLD